MRDKTGVKSNFSQLIDEENQNIMVFRKAIASGEAPKERIPALKSTILNSYIEITIAQYSLGASKEIVKGALLKTIIAFEEGFKWQGVELGYGQYEEMLWPLCLGILCDISDEDFMRITNIIKRDKVQDKLLDFIINGKLKTKWAIISHNYIEPSPYKFVDNFSSIAEIKKYLDKVWYKGQEDAAWYDYHKVTHSNLYFGYWAWEAATIVKIKGLDDSSLKDQKYYPYDAVHW
jgi:hypothetical protein